MPRSCRRNTDRQPWVRDAGVDVLVCTCAMNHVRGGVYVYMCMCICMDMDMDMDMDMGMDMDM